MWCIKLISFACGKKSCIKIKKCNKEKIVCKTVDCDTSLLPKQRKWNKTEKEIVIIRICFNENGYKHRID